MKVGCAIFLGLIIGQNQLVFGGWTGLINGLGIGWASVNVRSSTLKTNKVTTLNNTTSPSASIAPATGYKVNGPLPAGASTTTYARIKGFAGGFWQAASKAAVGDGTDNPELQNRVSILPADCASLNFDSMINQTQEEFNANGNSGTITVNAQATAGTALWLRGFEFTGSMEDVPADDPDTAENESIEYLKINGVLKFETLILGPFDFGGANCPLIVPFTLTSSNLEHLVFASDAAALSLPLVVVCPPDVVVSCDEPFSYPPVQYAGCGDIAITYNPAPLPGGFPAGYFPVGDTPVTVTATDSDGNSTQCTFTVTVNGLDFHGFYSPIGGTGGTCSSPLRTAKLGNNLPVKFDATCNGSPYSAGTPSLSIERSSQPCGTLENVAGGNFTPVGNEWHFNWDTSGQVTGNYKLTATLQDGSQQFVWIKLK